MWRPLRSILFCAAWLACDSPAPAVVEDAGADARTSCTSDMQCSDGDFCNGQARCRPGDVSADERGCLLAEAPACLPTQTCDSRAARCVTACAVVADADGDGERAPECGGADCNDADANVFPGNREVCDPNDRDEDCDPTTFGFRDADGDNYADARCCNVRGEERLCGTDCNDQAPSVHPAEAESCDTLDNDCDGNVDEGVAEMHWPDADGDGFGDASAEGVAVCVVTEGWSSNRLDCDDSSPTVNPSAPDVCDLVGDNDCNPQTHAFDRDQDGHDDLACGGDDCADTDAQIYPGHADADGDGHHRTACGGDDCNDSDATVYLGAPELCDLIDNDCSSGGQLNQIEDADRDGVAPMGLCLGGPMPVGDCDDNDRFRHANAPVDCGAGDNDCNPATVGPVCGGHSDWQAGILGHGNFAVLDSAVDRTDNLYLLLLGTNNSWGEGGERSRAVNVRMLVSFSANGTLRWAAPLQTRTATLAQYGSIAVVGDSVHVSLAADWEAATYGRERVWELRVRASDGAIVSGRAVAGQPAFVMSAVDGDLLQCGVQLAALDGRSGCARVTLTGEVVWRYETDIEHAATSSFGAIVASASSVSIVSAAGVVQDLGFPSSLVSAVFAMDGRFAVRALRVSSSPVYVRGVRISYNTLFSFAADGSDMRFRHIEYDQLHVGRTFLFLGTSRLRLSDLSMESWIDDSISLSAPSSGGFGAIARLSPLVVSENRIFATFSTSSTVPFGAPYDRGGLQRTFLFVSTRN